MKRSRAKKKDHAAPADSSESREDGKGTKAAKIYWDKDTSRTDRLIEYLNDNPEDRQKLFSDSSQDAKAESRRRRVAKGSKNVFYAKIADAVFSVDADKSVREDFAKNSEKYAKSVENRIST